MFKPFARFLCATALAGAVVAQSIFIAQPAANTNVTAGSDIIVQLDKPMVLTGSEDIAVVIGIFPCTYAASACPDVTDVLGDILYSGPYTASLIPGAWNPYENFTVTIPSWYSGRVQLGVAHFYLLGAGFSAELQFANTTLNVVTSG
ncbi:hypothetical protein OG21DRAFT_1486191 [Imleria badia]|nr:hypothetical protein OG21DRAFT_1486191 [Imleria badia]